MIWYVMFAQMTPKMMADCHSFHMGQRLARRGKWGDESLIEQFAAFSN